MELAPSCVPRANNRLDTNANKPRCSNLELYRILCMLMIVAHHFVVNSDVAVPGGPLRANPDSANTYFLYLFGMWGKTGINCFLMITGYFMCKSRITLRKFLKLLLQVYFFKLFLYLIFLIAGYETVGTIRLANLLLPFWGFNSNFTSCFIVFYLTIPFLTILVDNINKRQHQLLLILLLGCYTLMGTVPGFHVSFNYISWFGVIFFIASYIRMYPSPLFDRKATWGWLTLLSVLLAMTSVVVFQKFVGNYHYVFVSDSNKVLAVIVAVCSFLWFKNMKIPQSKVINAIGGSTFGVLLIHANSDAMRTWLWKDTVDVVGHYGLPIFELVLFSFGMVFIVFILCNLIDQLRVATLEKWFFNWYDSKLSGRADALVKRIIQE